MRRLIYSFVTLATFVAANPPLSLKPAAGLPLQAGKRTTMKKIKSPWYGIVWIAIWTAALVWFLTSGRFDERESIGLILVWVILVGVTVYLLIQRLRIDDRTRKATPVAAPSGPALNALCQCGSGKKYKRCCGAAK
jgi:hypothetical protein